MNRKKRLFITACVVSLLSDVLLFFIVPLKVWLIINSVLLFFALIATTAFIINAILKKTYWYKDKFIDFDHKIYPDNIWYREHDERNYDIVALGSSGAKFAYDFTGIGVKGMNWAQQPQTLQDDYKLFRSFHSILHKNGIVLINIMPFTSCNKDIGFMDCYKYIRIFYGAKFFDQRYHKKALLHNKYPILFRKEALIALIRYICGKDKTNKKHPTVQSMSTEEIKKDAANFVNGWKKQFGITDFNAPLTESNKAGRSIRIQLMRDLIDFIQERDYVPVFVILPVTEHLSSYYSEKFKETYIYSFLKEVGRDIKLLDYSNDKEFQKISLYFNSFFLNKKGAELITRRVIKDLNLTK